MVRILSIVAKFIRAFKYKWLRGFSCRLPTKDACRFQVFPTIFTGQSILDTTLSDPYFSEGNAVVPLTGQFGAMCSFYAHGKRMNIRLSDEDIQDALKYLYTKATREVERFNKPEAISKIAVKRDGILFFKGRISEGQRFLQTGGFEDLDVLRSQGINIWCPILDRWSPLSYAVGDHIHSSVAKHYGFETCYRTSHNFVHILRGLSLFQELSEDCVTCKKLNKRFVEAAMAPIHSSKFTIAPPFWATQCDLWGPITVYVPGREKNTRNTSSLSSKVYAMVYVCLVTKLTNIQIVESKDVAGLCDGLTRLACEVGAPAKLLIDQESGLMKMLQEGDIELLDLENFSRKKIQIDFTVCPVSGHNMHGLVEAKIRLAQVAFEKSGAGNLRLHATGAQTLAKLIEQDLNNTLYGITSCRGETNTPLLKLLSPQQMRLGRINVRNPVGPFKLPSGPKTLLDRVHDCYKLWYRAYQDTLLLKYLLDLQPKWFKNDRDMKPGDCVFFRKQDGKLEGDWQLGLVQEVVRSQDGVIRRVEIKYCNASENAPRFTDRAVRSVVRLFHVDDSTWKDDMSRVQQTLKECGVNVFLDEEDTNPTSGNVVLCNDTCLLAPHSKVDASAPAALICGCCCAPHKRFCLHEGKPSIMKVQRAMPEMTWPSDLLASDQDHVVEASRYLDVMTAQMEPCTDHLLSGILAIGTDLQFDSDI